MSIDTEDDGTVQLFNSAYIQARVLSLEEVDTYNRLVAKLGKDHVRECLGLSCLGIELITTRTAVNPVVVAKYREGMLTLAGALVEP